MLSPVPYLYKDNHYSRSGFSGGHEALAVPSVISSNHTTTTWHTNVPTCTVCL